MFTRGMEPVSENPDYLRAFLSGTSIFGCLEPAILDQVMALLKERRYQAGATVFAEGGTRASRCTSSGRVS